MSSEHESQSSDSGVTEWADATIGDLGEIHSGTTPRRSEPAYWGGSIPWVTPSEITALNGKWLCDTQSKLTDVGLRSSSLSVLPPETLLVTTRATIGEVAISAIPITTNQGFKSVVLDGAAEPLFAYYLLRLLAPEMRRKASGSTFDEISKRDFSGIPLSLPPLPEQRRIAEILDTVDAAIRHTEALIAKLEQVKAGLLHDLLTRGLDENGELRDPVRHPEQFKDSPLGRIPREWEVVRMREVVPTTTYGISEPLSYDAGIPVLRMNNLASGEVDLTDLKASRGPAARKLLLRAGDVLFNRTNSIEHVGRTAVWRGQLTEASFASYLVRLEPDPTRLDSEYLNHWMNLPATQLRIRKFATPGVQQVNINPTNLRKTLMMLPPVQEQERITARVDQHGHALSSEGRELVKLAQLKTALMQDLLTGRVRVALDAVPASSGA